MIPELHPDTYYLRTPEEQEYGPASLDTVLLWCREGRIGPDQMIRSDQQDWIPVTDMPELGFDWILVLEDGTEAGPFHLAMLEEQTKEGHIPAGAVFQHRHTQERRPAEMPADHQSPSLEPSQAPTATDAEDGTENKTDMESEAAIEQPSTPEAVAQENDDDLPVSLRLETLTRHAAEAREQLAETRAALNAVRQENTLLQDNIQHLQEQLASAQSARSAAESALLETQNLAAQNETEQENLRTQLAQIQEHYENIQLENQRQFEQIDDLRATALAAEQTWQCELSVVKTELDAKIRIIEEVTDVLAQAGSPIPNAATPIATKAAYPTPSNDASQPSASLPPAPPPAFSEPDGTENQKFFTWILPFLTLLFLSLMGFGIFSCSKWLQQDRISPRQEPETAPNAHATSPPASLTDAAPLPEETLEIQTETSTQAVAPTPSTSMPDWPDIQLANATMERDENALRIAFHYGLFASGTRLHDTAREDLLQLARQLVPHLDTFNVIIEGHTDAIPVRPGNEKFIDNFSLGMARAETVKHFLAEEGRLPTDRIYTASAGQASPPYPNDTMENRARNRTATISITIP